MISTKKKFKLSTALFIFLGSFFLIHLIFLTQYPAMHSDESWLSGLSRYMGATRNFAATEPFFDLKPRVPHAIRLFFHLTQVVFINTLGYRLLSVRLISLIAATICLYFISRWVIVLTKKPLVAGITLLFLSLDLSFIYSSHFARPEMCLLACLFAGLYFLTGRPHYATHRFKDDIIVTAIAGISIGIHPNSLIIAVCFSFFYIYQILIARKLKWIHLVLFLSGTFILALFFIGLSLYFNPNFLTDYLAYGQREFKVLNPLGVKWSSFCEFYTNIFHGDTGTYALPDLRYYFILYGIIVLQALVQVIARRESQPVLPLLAILAINLSILGVGRFNQTSIFFEIPFIYILLAMWVASLPSAQFRNLIVAGIILCLGFSIWNGVTPFLNNNYDAYLSHIACYVPSDQNTLASLNTEYHFAPNRLYDFRNLPYLNQKKLNFSRYIQKNHIHYIIYPESLDWIYRQDPRWNSVYGGLSGYYPEMKRFFKERCIVAGKFTDRIYGVEIGQYQGKRDWKITVYRVRNNFIPEAGHK